MKTYAAEWSDWLGKQLRRQFLLGVLVIVPLGVTILVFLWILAGIDNVLQPIIRAVWGRTIPGVGFVATILFVYIAGAIASNVLGNRLILYAESLLARVPLARQLYAGTKQILQSFSARDRAGFLQVVLVQFPRKGLWTIAFVVQEFPDQTGAKLLSLLIPNAPNPMSGFLLIAKEEEVTRTRVSVDDAVRMLVSAGRVVPTELGERLSKRS